MSTPAVLCPRCGPVMPLSNPRVCGSCPKCGRITSPMTPPTEMLTPRVTERQRAGTPPVDVQRDPAFERQFARQAARTVGINPETLIAFAASRTLPGPLREGRDRDWIMEVREELGDGLNYCCWRAQQMYTSGHPEGIEALTQALAYIYAAWHALDQHDVTRTDR
jgi:hypothetical protein